MALPLRPPIEPMLAKVEPEIPRGDGWRYEPKWDGFRSIVFRDRDQIRLGSRGRKELQRYFPELLEAMADALPERCVVDGEIVLASNDVLDFEMLQMRLHPAESRVRKLAGEIPASYVAFDLLHDGQKDLRKRPLSERWDRLAEAVPPQQPARALKALLRPKTAVVLTPHTSSPEKAERWFDEWEPHGLDGIIAKEESLTYQPGKRVMIKVKHQRTLEAVVGGYRIHKSGKGVGSLLLGLYDKDGNLRHIGASGAFSVSDRLAILEKLRPLEGGESFALDTM